MTQLLLNTLKPVVEEGRSRTDKCALIKLRSPMISDWYFCACIKSNAEQTETFLNILDIIRKPSQSDDKRLLFLALNELRRTELWMQIYAFHDVLQLLANYKQAFSEPIETYVNTLIDLVPDHLQPIFHELADSLITPLGTDDQYQLLEETSKISFTLSQREPSEVPYLDIREFLPEELILSAALSMLRSDLALRTFMLATLSDQNVRSHYADLFRKARSHEFGRHAFILASRIARMIGLDDFIEGIPGLLWKEKRIDVRSEPDLLKEFAVQLFGAKFNQPSSVRDEAVIAKLIDESVTFESLFRTFQDLAGGSGDAAIRRVARESSQETKVSLLLVYWQIAVWELAHEIDADAFARAVAPLWSQPPSRRTAGKQVVPIELPLDRKLLNRWDSAASNLIHLRGAFHSRIEIAAKTGKGIGIPEQIFWYLTSPWLDMQQRKDVMKLPPVVAHPKHKPAGEPQLRYPTATRLPLLIRMLLCSHLSIDILVSSNLDSSSKKPFSALVVHASDVLNNCYGAWLLKHTQTYKLAFPLVLSQHMTGFAKFLNNKLNRAGRAYFSSVSPDLFIQLLTDETEGATMLDDPALSSHTLEFERSVIPEVLFEWIRGGYPGATKGTHSSRWLKRIREVYFYYKKGDHSDEEVIETDIVVRFLRPESSDIDLNRYDWRHQIDNAIPQRWPEDQRLYLLSPPLPPTDWLVDADEHSISTKNATLLARAIERLASLEQLMDTRNGLSAEWHMQKNEWLNDFNNRLNAADKFTYRFTRLRLVEFLSSKVLADHPEVQQAIISFIMEFGSVYDIEKMLQVIFAPGDGEKMPNSTFLREYTTAYSLRELRSIDLGKRYETFSQDPAFIFSTVQKRDLLMNLLKEVLLRGRVSSSTQQDKDLASTLRRLQGQFDSSSSRHTLRRVNSDLQIIDGHKTLVFSDQCTDLRNWQLEGITYNPNRLSATFFLNDFDTDEYRDLFNEPRQNIDALLDDQTARTLKLVAVVLEIRNIEQDDYEYNFNFGAPFTKSLRCQLIKGLHIGSVVGLEVNRSPSGYWYIAEPQSIRRLRKRVEVGDITSLVLNETWNRNHTQRDLHISIHSNKLNSSSYDVALWDPDLSRTFHSPEIVDKRTLARLLPNRRFIPCDGDLFTLMSRELVSDNDSIRLVLVDQDVRGDYNETGWRFSVRPGDNYLLFPGDFVPNDAAIIDDVWRQLSHLELGPAGIALSVTPTNQPNGVKLQLSAAPRQDLPSKSVFTQLPPAFDASNLMWRDLFANSEPTMAEWDGTGWTISLTGKTPISFPDSVTVDWMEDRFPERNLKRIECVVEGWKGDNPRTRTVRAVYIPSNRLNLDPARREEFVKKWLTLSEGDNLVITRARGPIMSGLIPCLTQEGIQILVEAASITLDIVPDPMNLRLRENRVVEVFDLKPGDIDQEPQIDPSDIPVEALHDGTCQGILSEVPAASKDLKLGTYCKVLWQVEGQPPFERELQIRNLQQLGRLYPGAIIAGTQDNHGLVLRIRSPRIIATALWSLRDGTSSRNGMSFLGRGLLSNRTLILAQLQPGQLCTLSNSPPTARPFSVYQQNGFVGGIGSDQIFRDIEQEAALRFCRAMLHFRMGYIMGTRRGTYYDGDVLLNAMTIRLAESKTAPGMFKVRRELSLRPLNIEDTHTDLRSAKDGKLDLAALQKRLLECLGSYDGLDADIQTRKNVPGVILKEHPPVMVPDPSAESGWSTWVPLGLDEDAYFAQNDYRTEGVKVRLVEESSHKIVASFRKVLPFGPDEFMSHYDIEYGEQFTPREGRLHFIGEEFSEADNHIRQFRFEWGYGRCLLVPEDQLLYKDGPFRSSQFVLFHGDVITSLKFKSKIDSDDSPPRCAISIEETVILPSKATVLYSQATEYKVINILHLNIDGNGIKVEGIEGFDEKRILGTQRFLKIPARLSPDAESALIKDLASVETSKFTDIAETMIYGRLDTLRFEKTLGKDIYFHHVRLSFDQADYRQALKDGDLLFLAAGQIIQTINDVFLKVSEVKGIRNEDIGEDFTQLLILRREFSTRENLLTKILQTKGSSYLETESSRLPVRVRRGRDSKPLLSMLHLPDRALATLEGLVKGLSESIFIVQSYSASSSLRIELQPGESFTLKEPLLDTAISTLMKGDIVKIGLDAENRFHVSLLAPSEARYINGIPRPVVCFPKDNLSRLLRGNKSAADDVATWKQMGTFTIAGFPSLSATPGAYDSRLKRWTVPNPKQFVKLLSSRHPKLAWIALDDEGRIRISPIVNEMSVGNLKLENDKLTVSYFGKGIEGSTPTEGPIEWRCVSFADTTIANIKTISASEKWSYHDRVSGYMTPSWHVEEEVVLSGSTFKSPSFFEEIEGKPFLRYRTESLRHFGYPVGELIRSIRNRGIGSSTYSVAGVSSFGGLWLELAPGRIAELPAGLLVLHDLEKGQPFSALDWKQFAPGDLVELSLAHTDPLQHERIVFESWKYGPRNSLGKRNAYLRINSRDEKSGSVLLGAGRFKITIPIENPQLHGDTVVLTDHNSLEYQALSPPETGDTFLLTVGPSGKIEADGLRDYHVIPFPSKKIWEQDPLRHHLVTDRCMWNFGAAKNFLNAIGGALPVTVEKVDETKKIILFSRRIQAHYSHLSKGKFISAEVLGIDSYFNKVVLGFGAGFISISPAELISGIPLEFVAGAVELLRQKEVQVWLTVSEAGSIVGLSRAEAPEFYVSAVGMIDNPSGDADNYGIICQAKKSKCLYWLPSRRLAWASLSMAQADHVFFKGTRRFFNVRIDEGTRIVSRVDTLAVTREFNNLTVGNETLVQFIPALQKYDRSNKRYLVQSLSSDIELTCEVEPSNHIDFNEPFLADVVSRSLGAAESITVAPAGSRTYVLDLPRSMFGKGARKGLDPRQRRFLSVADYLPDRTKVSQLSTLEMDDLEQLLWLAYFQPESPNDFSIKDKVAIANAWFEAFDKQAQLEVFVPSAIVAILLMHDLAAKPDLQNQLSSEPQTQQALTNAKELSRKARYLFHNLGRRAIRSRHIEILQRMWLFDQDTRNRDFGLWKRLADLTNKLSSNLGAEDLQLIRQFAKAVRFRDQVDLLPIASALSAAIGELDNLEDISDTPDLISSQLIEICRTLPETNSSYSPLLGTSQISSLKQILDLIRKQGILLTYLDPISISQP